MRSWGVVSSCQCFYNGPLMIIKVVTPNTSIQPTFSVYPSPLSVYIKTEHSSAVCDAACQILDDQNSCCCWPRCRDTWKPFRWFRCLKRWSWLKAALFNFAVLTFRVQWSGPILAPPSPTPPPRHRHGTGPDFSQRHNILFSFLLPYLYFLSYLLSLMPRESKITAMSPTKTVILK